MGDCTITQLISSDASTAEAIRTLIEQLTGRESTFSEDDLRNVLQDSASRLFVMRHKESIVGMLSLGIYTCPTSRKVWVEDVVIDNKLRGKGLGEELVEYAINYVKKNLAPCSLMLTSRPSRVAANALYRKIGFEPRQTNVYKIEVDKNK
ncbi:MAG: GNAT family N-acetyltransferase [Alistipes sp.]|nr:GNAT family N-acetyltransferase [Alistipes sp.]